MARSTSRPIAGPRLDRTSRARATSVSEAFFVDPAQSTAAASAPSPSPRSNEAAHAWKPPQRPIATSAESQDAWIFRAPVPPLATFDTELGRAKCDNRVAFVLGAAGYDVANPAFALRPRHVQRVLFANGTAPFPKTAWRPQ